MQQTTTELGEDLVEHVVLALKEMDSPAFPHLGHSLRLSASSFNSLSQKRKIEVAPRSELVDMLNIKYHPCLGSLLKGDMEKPRSNFLDQKLHLNQLIQERPQGSDHACLLTYNRGRPQGIQSQPLSHHNKQCNNWVKKRGTRYKGSRSQRDQWSPKCKNEGHSQSFQP